VESAIRAIGESPEGSIPIWKKRSHVGIENSEMRQQRFVGILSSFDIVAFLAKSQCLEDQDKALKIPVSEVVVPNNSLLRVVDPATRSAPVSITMRFDHRILIRTHSHSKLHFHSSTITGFDFYTISKHISEVFFY